MPSYRDNSGNEIYMSPLLISSVSYILSNIDESFVNLYQERGISGIHF